MGFVLVPSSDHPYSFALEQPGRHLPCLGPHSKEGLMAQNPHTGQKTPASGIYKPTNGGKEIAVSKGDRLPPAKGKATSYKLVRPTK